MQTSRTVLLYGSSLLIAGMAVSLRDRPDLRVMWVETTSADGACQFAELRPDAIVVDRTDGSSTDLPDLAHLLETYPGTLIVGLDLTSREVTLLSSHQQSVSRIEDLADVIRAGLPHACAG